jgi:hypothetical protein
VTWARERLQMMLHLLDQSLLLKEEAKRRRKGSWGSENTTEGMRTQVDSTALHYVPR